MRAWAIVSMLFATFAVLCWVVWTRLIYVAVPIEFGPGLASPPLVGRGQEFAVSFPVRAPLATDCIVATQHLLRFPDGTLVKMPAIRKARAGLVSYRMQVPMDAPTGAAVFLATELYACGAQSLAETPPVSVTVTP